MRYIQRARPGEELKPVLVTLDHVVWRDYKRLMQLRGMSASSRLRAFMAREVRKAQRNGELTRG